MFLLTRVAVLDLDEKTAQAFRGDVGLNVFGIETVAGFGNTRFADVGTEKLGGDHGRFIAQIFRKRDGQGIGFLAGRTAGSPNAKDGIGLAVLHNARKDLSLESLEDARIAKEAGHVDKQILIEGFDFGGILLDVLFVVLELLDFMDHHAAVEATANGGVAVEGKIHTRGFVE
jgi:hypothetical protein